MRRLLVLLGGTVLAGGALVGVAAASGGDAVPRGVHVAGTSLAGLDRTAALAAAERALADTAATPLVLDVDGEPADLVPVRSGLGIDLDAVVDDALATGPVALVRGLLGGRRDVDPVPEIDDDALVAAVTAVAQERDRPPREGAVRFEGTTPVSVAPLDGRTVDVEATAQAVRDAWLREAEATAVVEVEQVATDDADVETALTAIARPAVAAPVSVAVGDGTLAVQPADIAAALSIEADDGVLVPRLDAEALLASLGDRVDAVQTAPVDAQIRIEGGKPAVVPSRAGLDLPGQALAEALLPVLARPEPRTATVALAPVEPQLTTAQAEALGVTEIIGTFTTRYPCCRPRVTNIRRIAELVDGELVLPGETYSLNGDVGERTRAKGFVDAPQILDGEFVDDVGGGVSQFATTMFNAVFFAGLEDVEHKAHSYYITRYPEGREATVFFPTVDLKWRNDSGKGVLVTTSSTGTSVTVTLWGTKRYDISAEKGPRTRVRGFEKRYVQREDCTAAAGHEGFDIVVTRVFRQGGKEVERERFSTRYLPEPNFICGPPPSARPAPSAAPSPQAAPSSDPAT